LGVQLLRHGADIGQAVSLASLRERGGMCGRQCRVGARNGGQDAVVGRGGNTAEGQLGRLSGCEQRCRRRTRGHVRAGWAGGRVLRQRVRRAGGPRSDDMWTRRDEPRVHRDNRASEGMTYFLRRAKAHFTSSHAAKGPARRNGVCSRRQAANCFFYGPPMPMPVCTGRHACAADQCHGCVCCRRRDVSVRARPRHGNCIRSMTTAGTTHWALAAPTV
jgi:hypothetical protein